MSYLNNEKHLKTFISVCIFENLFLMSVKMPWLLFTSLDDPDPRICVTAEMCDQTGTEGSALFERVSRAQVLRSAGF